MDTADSTAISGVGALVLHAIVPNTFQTAFASNSNAISSL
jgi:hypothetical protein